MISEIKAVLSTYLAARLAEPGTRVALISLLGTLGMKVSPDFGEVIINVLIIFLGGAVATPDSRIGRVSKLPTENNTESGVANDYDQFTEGR